MKIHLTRPRQRPKARQKFQLSSALLGSVMLTILLAGSNPAAFSAESNESENAAARSVGTIDLLSAPLEETWEHFSEDPASQLSQTWQLQDGVLLCRGLPKGYLFLNRDVADFILRLEWRWPAGKKPGNGGVLVRTTGPDKIWPRSLEAQLNAGQAGDFWGLDGFTLDGPAERKKTIDNTQFGRLTNLQRIRDLEKPAGEWNQYEIVARGSTVTLVINGREANRATGCDRTAGKICLTAEGDAIEFRHLSLKEMK